MIGSSCKDVDFSEAVNTEVDALVETYTSENNLIHQILGEIREHGDCRILIDQTKLRGKFLQKICHEGHPHSFRGY